MREQLKELFSNEYGNYVKRLSHQLTNTADAEDVVMNTFTKALTYEYSYKQGEDIKAWFDAILRNELKDWKAVERRQGMTVEVNEKNGGEVECKGEKKQVSSFLVGEVNRMKPSLKKDVVYRRFFMELSIKQIADVSGVSKERVKKILYRWRGSMKKRYGEGVFNTQ